VREHSAQQHLCLLHPSASIIPQVLTRAKPSDARPRFSKPLCAPYICHEHDEHFRQWIKLHQPITSFVRLLGQQQHEASQIGHPDAIWQDHPTDAKE
jgi:hypothetical protein